MHARTYEALGVRGLYRFVARIVGETPLPPFGQPACWVSKGELEARHTATRYFENANYARAACYAPHFAAFLTFGHILGTVYTVCLVVLHALVSMVERYKRLLIEGLLESAPETVATSPVVEADRHRQGLADLWYRPKRFETERFYRLIGIEYFRAFVEWVMRVLTYGFSGQRVVYLPQPTRAQVVEFERETRISEGVHLVGIGLTLPTVVFTWQQPWLVVSIWATAVALGEVGLSLLQRYHRLRVWPVVSRALARKARS